jgi:hypothetical protein
VNVVLPAALGVPAVGVRLLATIGTWNGVVSQYAFAWQRCDATGLGCAPIAGGTTGSYLLTAADVGSTIRIAVTATGPAGSLTAVSAATAPVAAQPPPPPPSPPAPLQVSEVQPPDHLVLDQVAFNPELVRSLTAPVTLRAHVADAGGANVVGALVAVPTATPQLTGPDGWAQLQLLPGSLPRDGKSLTVAIEATDPANPTGAISAFETSQLLLALPPPPSAPPAPRTPYAPGTVGYDVSWPNCGVHLPGDGRFLIVGVNGGEPFTQNPCLAAEVGWGTAATIPVSLYLNTGYSARLLPHISTACRTAASSLQLGSSERRAHALGCSEAAAAVAYASGINPAQWWLDVEPSNPWSSRTTLNAAVLSGMIEYLRSFQPAATIGVYSNRSWWGRITGTLLPLQLPEWTPDPPTADPCRQSFAFGPVWLLQGGSRRLDRDRAC